MITVRSTINLAHQSVPEVIPAVQGDTGRSILFSLADFTIPTGATARYFITKPSGLAVYNDATIDGNTVLVDLTAQSLAEYGDCPGQVRISVGDDVVTSFEFILHVEPFRGIDAVESTNETNIFDQAIKDAEEYISQAIDPTLTIANKAADAKATGDFIWSIFPTESATGNPATFDDGADNVPVKDLKVSIVPQQAGSGDPSPDNVRPITGTEEVGVEVADDEETKAEYTIPLDRTVYGGTLDVTTGVLTVDKAKRTVTNAASIVLEAGIFYVDDWNDMKRFTTYIGRIFCDRLETSASMSVMRTNPTVPAISGYVSNTSFPGQNWLYITNGTAQNAEEMKAWLADNPLEVVYELATPLTYQLTPQELTTILGTNNIFTDAESVDVVYRADIAMYIENLTEPDADMIADTNITSGSYFMVGNTLYLATANIANGAAVVVGTNCVRSNLASALNAINA